MLILYGRYADEACNYSSYICRTAARDQMRRALAVLLRPNLLVYFSRGAIVGVTGVSSTPTATVLL